MQASSKKAGQPIIPGGTSLLAGSSHSSINNIKSSSNSQQKGPSPSSKTLSNNNSASQPNPQLSGSSLQSSNQLNNIKVRNDLMPGSAAALNNKALPASSASKQHPGNAYQGNNGLQGTPGVKGTASFISSAQQKEDSPSSLDANSSSHPTKTKAMLKGRILLPLKIKG